MADMKRNLNALRARAKTHVILNAEQDGDKWLFAVKSGGSGKVYKVERRIAKRGPDTGKVYWTCNCDFSAGYKGGCTHVMRAAETFEMTIAERQPSVVAGVEAAARQHRPTENIGQGLYMVSRP